MEIESDPWATQALTEADKARKQGREVPIRRPLRGLEIKDPTYSYLRVLVRFGESLLFMDSTDPDPLTMLSDTFANYLITSLTMSRMEKVQIVETFGESYIFAYGERPVQANLSGGLVDSADFTWPTEFWENYQNLMRATKLADMGARLYLYVNGRLIEGLAMGANDSMTSDQPNLIPFNLSLLVTNIQYLDRPTFDYPIRSRHVQDVDILRDPAAWNRLMTMAQEERSKYLEWNYGVQTQKLVAAKYEREHALYSAATNLGALFEMAKQGGPNSGFVFQGLAEARMLDSINEMNPPSTSTRRAALERRSPVRGRITDNVDEYVQGVPMHGLIQLDLASLDRQMDGAYGTPEAAGESGLSPPEEIPSAFDEGSGADRPDMPSADDSRTSLQEAVGADPAADPSSGSGVLTGRDIEQMSPMEWAQHYG